MAATAELASLHRTVDELRRCVDEVQHRYGDIPAVRRIVGDVERIDLDATELDAVAPPSPPPPAEIHVLDDRPLDPSLWADADDEGVGGYHGGDARRR